MVDKEFEQIADGISFRRFSKEEMEEKGIRDLVYPKPLERIIVHKHNLIESYRELMPYQPREANVACFAKHNGKGIYEITNIVDITKEDTSEGGIDDASVPIELQDMYFDTNRYYVGQFHSHPSGFAGVSDRDRACAERHRNSYLFASITPEGIVSFFGNLNYEVCGDVKKINKNQYQLDINNIDGIIDQIEFEPLSEEEEFENIYREIEW